MDREKVTYTTQDRQECLKLDSSGRLTPIIHFVGTIPAPPQHLPNLVIPSFFIRKWRVERFSPKRTAAPFGPERVQLVSLSIRRMC